MKRSSYRDIQFRRTVAAIAAILLLLGQSIAAAHFHRVATHEEFSASSVAVAADGGCAICAFHFHSSALAAVAPTLAAPALAENLHARAVSQGPRSAYDLHRFGRAPPASV